MPSVPTYHDRVLYTIHQQIIEDARASFDLASIKARVKALNIVLGPRSNEFIRKALTSEVREGRIKRIGSDQEPRTMSDATLFIVVNNSTAFYSRASLRVSAQYGLAQLISKTTTTGSKPKLTVTIVRKPNPPTIHNENQHDTPAQREISVLSSLFSEGSSVGTSPSDSPPEQEMGCQLFYPDDDREETTSSFQETLLGATLDVVGNYVRQAEENPAKILEALQKAESTPTNGTYPEFTLKVLRALGTSIKRKELLTRVMTGLKTYVGVWSHKLESMEEELKVIETGSTSFSTA